MSKQNVTVTAGTPFLTLLAVVFITLKLLDKIDWSWRWVLAPIWVPGILAIVIIVFAVTMAVVTGQTKKRR